jgi:hypothetical protein
MTKTLYPYLVAIALLVACSTSAEQNPKQDMPKGSNVNPDAGLAADFRKKVDDYVKLRDDAAKNAPPMKDQATPAEISAAESTLGKEVRAMRANAKRGDFFTPATQAMFRRLLRPAVKGPDGGENKQAIKDDAPEPKEIPFQVNASYPKHLPLSTVPPDVLQSLPALPKDQHVEYRFTGKHLLLYDATANLIIDFMLNALP